MSAWGDIIRLINTLNYTQVASYTTTKYKLNQLHILTKSNRPCTITTLDIKSKSLYTQILSIDTFNGFLLTIEFPSSIQEWWTRLTLNTKWKHHTNGDQIILWLFTPWYEFGIKVGWDVFVKYFSFTHDYFVICWLFDFDFKVAVQWKDQ